jgi:type I restriction enzyme S subunit
VKYIFDAHLQREYKKFTQGAAQDNLSQGKLLSLKFYVPDIYEQRVISDILSAYDDLIENNRRRIQLLEESARLLYREWFVRLRFPGYEHVKIIDGVPEGWEKKQVKHVLGNVKRPRKIKKSEFLPDGPIPCVDQSRDFIGGYTEEQEAVIDEGKPIIVFGDHTRILKFVDFPFACASCRLN